jgi:RND family efflux transporter MFP subunit
VPSNYSNIVKPAVIIILASVIAGALYLNRPEPEKAEITRRPLLVNALKAVKQDIRVSVRAQGIITPRTQTSLIAEVSGRIITVSEQFKVGGYFNKGDTLLEIDHRDYEADLKRAEAAVASAKSNLASEKGRADVAYKDWLKYKSSVQRSQSANDLSLRKPQLIDAEAKLASAIADLDSAHDQLDRTTIRAPYSGLVRSKQVDVGQYVNIGSALAETFAIDFAELRLALPDNKLNYLELPTLADRELNTYPKVTLFADIGGEKREWQGKVVRTEGVFDERSRVLFAVAEINDPYGLTHPQQEELRIGTFVDARIEGRLIPDLVPLPRHLLRAGNQIWVIDNQQRLQNRQVSILRTEGHDVYVTNGLNNGELVCLSNIIGAIPGTKVRVSTVTASQLSKEQTAAPEKLTDKEALIDLAPTDQLPTPSVSPPESSSTLEG